MKPEEKVNILLVDDDEGKLLALENILSGLGQNLVQAHSGKEALRALLHQDFAVVLLDVRMPVMDGFETAAMMRERKKSAHLPIIFVTAADLARRTWRGATRWGPWTTSIPRSCRRSCAPRWRCSSN
jgi:CheY-like chemotaxis protein